MPSRGEGETMASQIATAVNKLVYKWYNDGDVFDNNYILKGWCNDLSSYANWLDKYVSDGTDCDLILHEIVWCRNEGDYEQLLFALAKKLLDPEYLELMDEEPKQGSIYDCEGRYSFNENTEDDEDDYWADEEDEDEEEYDESLKEGVTDRLRQKAEPLANALDELTDRDDGFYITYSIGMDDTGSVTGGVDFELFKSSRTEEEAKAEIERVFDENGFELDRRFKTNPGKTLFGRTHYQIIEKGDYTPKLTRDDMNAGQWYESLKEGYKVDYLERELADKSDRPSIEDAYQRNNLTIERYGDVYYIVKCPTKIYSLVKREMKKFYPDLQDGSALPRHSLSQR